jgi:7-alpha-hydroxysteroid dehydrogenase
MSEHEDSSGWFRLDGKAAIVTGASKGIGRAIALTYAEAGADVAVVSRTASEIEAVADEVRARGRNAVAMAHDMNDIDGIPALVERTVAEFGRLDIVVSNAGGSPSYPVLDTRVEHLEAAFRFNVVAAFELARLSIPHLLAQGGGSIITVSSMAGTNSPRGQLAYGTAKAALSHMTELLAADLSPRIRVNALLPGPIATSALASWLETLPSEAREVMLQRTPMRRLGHPDDIAACALYLAAPASVWVSGKRFPIDGMAWAELVPKGLVDL